MKLAFTLQGGLKKPPVFKKQTGLGQPISTGAGAVYHYNRKIEKGNSFFDRFKEPYKNCKVIGKNTTHPKILLPRMKRPMGKLDLRELGEEIDINIILPPREKQLVVCDQIDDLYEDGRTGFIINASTGFGKTYLGCHAIGVVKKTTLILIHKSDLEKQWRTSLKKFLGLGGSDIGLIKGDICSVAGKAVVIGYVQSLMKEKRYNGWVYDYFGLVIVDEVHIMAAGKFVNCMYQLPAKYRLGLSATTDRPDNKQHVFKDHIGKVLIKVDALPMPFNVLKISTGVQIPAWIPFKPGRMMTLCNWLGKHPQRQYLISSYVKKAYVLGRTIVCFADTKKHLDFAWDCLIDAGVNQNDIGRYQGGMTDAELETSAFKKVILATYKMTSVGTDYPHWDTAVLMTPKADARQVVGRVVREMPDKKMPLVLDFVDQHKLLLNFYSCRKKWYSTQANLIRER